MDTNLLKRKPDDPFYLWKRAELYRKIGQYDQAIEDYGKSIALNPQEAAAAYYGRALAYAFKGDSRKSIQDLRNAIQLDPGYKAKVLSEAGFNSLRHHPDFIKLIRK